MSKHFKYAAQPYFDPNTGFGDFTTHQETRAAIKKSGGYGVITTRVTQRSAHSESDGMVRILSLGMTSGKKIGAIPFVMKPDRMDCLQLPGGGIDPGEEADEAGKRELDEETGISPGKDFLEQGNGLDRNRISVTLFVTKPPIKKMLAQIKKKKEGTEGEVIAVCLYQPLYQDDALYKELFMLGIQVFPLEKVFGKEFLFAAHSREDPPLFYNHRPFIRLAKEHLPNVEW